MGLHYWESGHGVIQPYQPGEGWRYMDDAILPETEPSC